jgi:glycosyltransferase involved in cell wall biosynthesis
MGTPQVGVGHRLDRQPEQAILTVAIPTYRRPEALRRLLLELADDAGNLLGGLVEILVCDNSEDDQSKDVVTSLAEAGLPLRYVGDGVNCGYDRNVLRCYEHACGRFVWLLGDDDCVLPGATLSMVQALERRPMDVLVLNSPDQRGSLELSPLEVVVTEPAERWLVVSQCVWLSRVVVRRDPTLIGGLLPFVGTRLMQLALVNGVLLRGAGQAVVSDWLSVKNNPHVAFSAGFLRAFSDGFYEVLSHPSSGFPPDLAREVAWRNLTFLADARIRQARGEVELSAPPGFLDEIMRCVKYRAPARLYARFAGAHLLSHWRLSTRRNRRERSQLPTGETLM